MKVLLLTANNINVGDRTIGSVEISILRRIAPDAVVVSAFIDNAHGIEFVSYLISVENPDFIIVGGGGLWGKWAEPFWQSYIIAMRLNPKIIGILWAVGINDHYNRGKFDRELIANSILVSTLVGVRGVKTFTLCKDLNPLHPLIVFTPCPTIRWAARCEKNKGEGVLFIRKPYCSKPLEISDKEVLYHAGSFDSLMLDISRAETVISMSYHGAYWAFLLGKKVIIISNSSRLDDLATTLGLKEMLLRVDEDFESLLPQTIRESKTFKYSHDFKYKMEKHSNDFVTIMGGFLNGKL